MIKEIDFKTARDFTLQYHYLNKFTTGGKYYFGWYIDEKLYSVITYGYGVNKNIYSYLSNKLNIVCNKYNTIEILRLCRSEPKLDKYPLSKFISKTNKFLKKKGYKIIYSYSDPFYGHDGGIYKASNFKHLGKTDRQGYLIDIRGNIYHKKYLTNYAKRNNIKTKRAREQLGLEWRYTKGKDRWYILL